MSDETPQSPSTAEQTTPSPPTPQLAPADPEAPLASLELEEDQNCTSPAPAEVVGEAVTVVEKESPLTPAASDVAVLAADQVPSSLQESLQEKQRKRASQPLSAALKVPQEPAPETTQKEVTLDAGNPSPKVVEEFKKVPEAMPSFKEESNRISDLSEPERKSLGELKLMVQEAISTNTLIPNSNSPLEVSMWGVPLMKDERTDVILLKFLRAREFKVKESFFMLKDSLIWRNKYNVDGLVDEELWDDLDKVVFMQGHDKEGHPVCYNVYGEFQNKELYNKAFGNEDKRKMFLRWRIQFLERSIRKLDFSPGGINTIFQVSDLKNAPGPGKRELRIATKQALQLLQDNYPEFVAKQVFINVPWWYLAFYTMISPFLTQRTKSKFVFAGPSKTAETLFKYISPEQVPVQYGGLGVDFCDCNSEFTVDDLATELIVKPATKQTVEIIIHEKCIIVWELRVVGWEVSYTAEFVPNDESAYTMMITKKRRMSATDEPVISNSFKVSELGKILLTINNPTSKKKHLLYRFKVKPYGG